MNHNRRRLGCFLGTLRPSRLHSRSPHPLVIHAPSLITQQGHNPTVSITAILQGKTGHVFNQPGLIIGNLDLTTLSGPGLLQDLTGPPLGTPHPFNDMLNSPTLPGRAQKFPRCTSSRICLSSDRSATSFFS